MSWECRHKSGDHCYKLERKCDPGIKGCVLHGKVYFPFAPHKNPPGMVPGGESDDPADVASKSETNGE